MGFVVSGSETMSIITTFENQCRALTSVSNPDENASRFLVGTQSPNSENLIYLFEYKDDNNDLAKVSYKFPYGEVWHLATSSKYPNHMTAVTGQNGKLKVSLFKLPQELENPIEDDYGLSESQIEKTFDLVTGEMNLTPQSHWHPDDGDQILICSNGSIQFWDVNQQQQVQTYSLSAILDKHIPNPIQTDDNQASVKHPKVSDLRWSSLFNCSVMAAAVGSRVYGIDTRISHSSPSSICWLIEDQKCNRIKSIDFNPNSQYYLASGGDDCRANFWDLRKITSPALHFQTHTHWIWSIRYNPFHDQLVLSAGSDARVALMRVQSIASEPFGQMSMDEYEDEEAVEDEVLEENSENQAAEESRQEESEQPEQIESSDNKPKEPKQTKDEVIKVYEEHDDSVYVAEWATDPWIFASLGYESRLVISKVPKSEKFDILF